MCSFPKLVCQQQNLFNLCKVYILCGLSSNYLIILQWHTNASSFHQNNIMHRGSSFRPLLLPQVITNSNEKHGHRHRLFCVRLGNTELKKQSCSQSSENRNIVIGSVSRVLHVSCNIWGQRPLCMPWTEPIFSETFSLLSQIYVVFAVGAGLAKMTFGTVYWLCFTG